MAVASIFRAVLLATLVSVLAAAVPGTAAAQDQAAVNKVTNLNKKAIDALQKKDYETARELLKQALELCASAGLRWG
jgi:outer membrane protein assembly factor BamD (BamD/ComL family)